MEFEKDIFISYAHNDNHSITDAELGWISDFHNTLKIMVMEKLGVEPVIWRDNSLQGNDEFTPAIKEAFEKSKVMVSVITPRYVQSTWCKKEINEFYNAASLTGGISIENHTRIFKVIKTPVEPNLLPEVIKPFLSYEFFKLDEFGTPVEFNKIFGPQMEQLYFSMLNSLSWHISNLIKSINSKYNIDGHTDLQVDRLYNERTIYLAETTQDLKEYRNKLKGELEDNGFTVYPNRIIENEKSVYQNDVTEFINKSSLSIHLIGSKYGSIPEGSEKSTIEIQNEIATVKSQSEGGLTRLIWTPKLTPIDDSRLLNLLDQLNHKEELQNGSDLLEGSIQEFTAAIFDTLKKLDAADKEKKDKEAAAEKAKLAAASTKNTATATDDFLGEEERKTIFIICDERDKSNIAVIRNHFKTSGFDVDKMSFDGTDEEKKVAYDISLRDCDAVFVYYGQGSESWLKAKIGEIKRKPAITGARKLKAVVIYKGEPATESKEEYDDAPANFLVVNGQSGFNPALLNDFINKLK